MEKDRALAHLLKQHPVRLAHMLGYNLLREGLHDMWIRDIAYGKHDMTLQAHRGSYKTTSLEVALWVIMLTQPDKTVGFLRKSETDVSEVFSAVEKMLRADVTQYIAEIIYGRPVRVTTASSTELSCDIACNVSGVSQVSGYGIGGSLTGKHWDIVCTDDIVTVRDRYSRAERERTKQVYRELQNVKNRGGRIVNTGTPWHKDDAFKLMPEPVRWPWDKTGLITQKEAETLKKKMTHSLFAANYELRHVAEEGAVFEGECQSFKDESLLYDGVMHVDAKSECVIFFLGGGADKEQTLIYKDLLARKESILKAKQSGTAFLLICGGYLVIGAAYLVGARTLHVLRLEVDLVAGPVAEVRAVDELRLLRDFLDLLGSLFECVQSEHVHDVPRSSYPFSMVIGQYTIHFLPSGLDMAVRG